MTLLVYKFLSAISIFLLTMAAAFYPLKKQFPLKPHVHSFELGEALASGIFLGAAFFHMLPDSIKLFQQCYGTPIYPFPEVICIAGFLLLLFLERLSLSKRWPRQQAIPYILVLILTIHALTEGAALGIGDNLSETIMLLIAILAHKGSESFALAVTLIRHQLNMRQVLLILLIFSAMTPLGIGVGAAVDSAFFHHAPWIAASFNAFAAGTFLYISTLHHVHFHQHHASPPSILEFICLVLGTAAMGVIAIWV